jgi:TPR repeat protein
MLFHSSASRRFAALGTVVLLAAAPAQAQYGGSGSTAPEAAHKEGKSSAPPESGKQAPLNAFESALKFKQQGDFPKAIALLEPQAKLGRGFEMAQLVLGQCYVASADKEPTPEAANEAAKKGAVWIAAAAEGGLSAAQEQMVRLYTEGGRFKVEPVEAGKWYLIWKSNPARFQAVGRNFDPKLEQKLKTTLTDAQWDQAQAAAIALANKANPQ